MSSLFLFWFYLATQSTYALSGTKLDDESHVSGVAKQSLQKQLSWVWLFFAMQTTQVPSIFILNENIFFLLVGFLGKTCF